MEAGVERKWGVFKELSVPYCVVVTRLFRHMNRVMLTILTLTDFSRLLLMFTTLAKL